MDVMGKWEKEIGDKKKKKMALIDDTEFTFSWQLPF